MPGVFEAQPEVQHQRTEAIYEYLIFVYPKPFSNSKWQCIDNIETIQSGFAQVDAKFS